MSIGSGESWFRALSPAHKREGWLRRHEDGEIPLSLDVSTDAINAGVPLGTADQITCWLWLRYRRLDPCVVTIEVCAPSNAVVMERAIMRSDLVTALSRAVSYVGLGLGPGVMRGITTVYLREDNVTVTLLLPTEVITRFVTACENFLPAGRAQAEVLDDVFHAMLGGAQSESETR